jgi:hypothetical protein
MLRIVKCALIGGQNLFDLFLSLMRLLGFQRALHFQHQFRILEKIVAHHIFNGLLVKRCFSRRCRRDWRRRMARKTCAITKSQRCQTDNAARQRDGNCILHREIPIRSKIRRDQYRPIPGVICFSSY